MIRDGECESMLILQLSDFHFNAHENSKDEQRYKQIVDALLYEVKAQATPKRRRASSWQCAETLWIRNL